MQAKVLAMGGTWLDQDKMKQDNLKNSGMTAEWVAKGLQLRGEDGLENMLRTSRGALRGSWREGPSPRGR